MKIVNSASEDINLLGRIQELEYRLNNGEVSEYSGSYPSNNSSFEQRLSIIENKVKKFEQKQQQKITKQKYPIEIKLNTEVTDVKSLGADEVIIATGAKARRIPVKGVENTIDAVVHIKTELTKSTPLYENFFGMIINKGVQNQTYTAFGSGVIIESDGYIITNNHVVQDAERITVTMNDKRTFAGTLVGNDPSTDLALIKIDAEGLQTIPWGNSDNARVGEWVLAIGNPFNLTSTVTAGIISAKARNMDIIENTDGLESPIESFIQTDAAVNSGNSGGALVNARGELVGINAVLSSPTGAYAGYGFAIPTSIMTKVVGDLKEFGTVQRAILGISGHDLGDERTKDKDLGTVEGVYVAEVTDGSGAKAAGIETGDVIVKVAGKKVHNMAELQESLTLYRPGDKVEVTLLRNKKDKTLTVTLKNLQGNTEVVKKFDLSMLGAAFKPISDDVKRHLGVSYGLEVTGVDKGKFAEAGIKKGFIILKVNGTKITSEEDLAEALKAANQSPERVLFISGYYMSGRRANYAVELASEKE